MLKLDKAWKSDTIDPKKTAYEQPVKHNNCKIASIILFIKINFE